MAELIMTRILKKIKNSQGCTLIDLMVLERFEHIDVSTNYILNRLFKPLKELVDLGLVQTFEGETLIEPANVNDYRKAAEKYKFFFSPLASEIELALGMDLAVGTKSIFGDPIKSGTWPQVFVLMPFVANLKPVYDDHIKDIASEAGLTVGRADDFFSTGSVVQEIWSAIHNSLVIIADCTGRNPNVFYEIGIAHTLGKETILISQSIDDIPFDLRHLRFIVYEYTPRGMSEFEKKLGYTLYTTLNKNTFKEDY